MSRIGRTPITIPEGVSVEVRGRLVRISGPQGEIEYQLRSEVSVSVVDNILRVKRVSNSRLARALHGTTRANLANAVLGVCEGYEKNLVLEGLGYRAKLEGGKLLLEVGFSHPIEFVIPEGIGIEVEGKNQLRIFGVRKDLVGQEAARIRDFHPPEPYRGRGIRYRDEIVRLKPGKAAKVGEGI